MTDPTPDTWRRVDAYLTETLVGHDPDLEAAVAEQHAAGLAGDRGRAGLGKAAAPARAHLGSPARARDRHARRVLDDLDGAGHPRRRPGRHDRGGARERADRPREPRSRRRRRQGRDPRSAVPPTCCRPSRAPSRSISSSSTPTRSRTRSTSTGRRGSGAPAPSSSSTTSAAAARSPIPPPMNPQVIGTQRGLELLGRDPRFDATALQTLDLKGYDGIAIAVVV